MNEQAGEKAGWKQRAVRELAEYWINVAYLFLFFGVFTMYRRLVLAQYKISYLHYGYAFFKALVLAKIIMIGDALGLARRLQDRPLIVTTLYKAVVFAVWVVFFNAFERVAEGLLEGRGLAESFQGIGSRLDILFAGVLVVFFSFIPFFAFKELGRVLGIKKIAFLFFRSRSELQSELSQHEKDKPREGEM
ncbi:MAG: hypothetical protein ACP5SH_24185 [Syntrophobacteraceae bacterium]